jgi:hypothetical protein
LIEIPVILYVGVLGSFFVTLLSHVPDETQIYDPETAFKELVEVLHYFPANWEHLTLHQRYDKLKLLFRYRWINLIYEILSVFYTPFLLAFYFSHKTDLIVEFFRENSVHIPNLGIICSSSLLGHGKHLIENKPLKDKMSSSLVNFNESHPKYQVDEENGSTLCKRNLNSNILFETEYIYNACKGSEHESLSNNNSISDTDTIRQGEFM